MIDDPCPKCGSLRTSYGGENYELHCHECGWVDDGADDSWYPPSEDSESALKSIAYGLLMVVIFLMFFMAFTHIVLSRK